MLEQPALTVVVPVKDRRDLVRRLFSYLARTQFPFPLVIADDSTDEAAAENGRAIADLVTRGVAVTHRVFPPTPMVPKIAEGLEAVETPFAVLGADDDFFVPESLRCAVEFLASHPDYAIAHGRAALLSMRWTNGVARVRGVSAYPQREIDSSSSSRRLLYHLQRFTSTWYSVHRSADLKDMWRRTANLELDLDFSELLASCLAVVRGKIHKGDYLYMVRERNLSGAGASLPDPFTWMTSPDWCPQYHRFKDCLIAALARAEPDEASTHPRLLADAFSWYLARYFRQFGDPGGESPEPFDLEAVCDPRFRFYREFVPILEACEAPSEPCDSRP